MATEAASLDDVLVAQLESCMIGRGWTVAVPQGVNTLAGARAQPPTVSRSITLAYFRHPVEATGFVATAAFERESEFEMDRGMPRLREGTVVHVTMVVGVTHPKSEQLLAMLGARHCNLAVECYLDELPEARGVDAVPIANAADVGPATERLASLAGRYALPFATVRSTVEAYLTELTTDEGRLDFASEQVPALLMAAERPDEAREALARYGRVAGADYERFRLACERHWATQSS
jgi:hypothetical protein